MVAVNTYMNIFTNSDKMPATDLLRKLPSAKKLATL